MFFPLALTSHEGYNFAPGSRAIVEWYITRLERGSKGFYPRVWRENPRGAAGGKTIATEQEGGV